MSWRSQYLFCPKCFNVYFANQIAPTWETGRASLYCPSALCSGHGELVTLDELMIKPIVKLNKKGYRTRYCCSGHEMREKEDRKGYILFDENRKFSSLPEGWEDEGFSLRGTCIRSTTNDLALSITNLNKWVDGLEDLKGEENIAR